MIKKFSKMFGLLAAIFIMATPAFAASYNSVWITAGNNLQNTRNQAKEKALGVSNVSSLGVQWQFTTGGDVSATPAVDEANIYFPDWAGNLFAVSRATGQQVWVKKISDVTNIPGDRARATPAIAGSRIVIGDQGGYLGGNAYVMAFDKNTGDVLWRTQVESGAFPIVTQSAVVNGNTVYVGVASAEEAFAGFIPGYTCCSFRGSILALDVRDGSIKWQTYTVPQGYSGGSVWGSTPVVDAKRDSLYITTGNNYSVPTDVQDCVLQAGSNTDAIRACNSPNNHPDSILSLDLKSGAIKWATMAIPFDSFNITCVPYFPGLYNLDNCPAPAGPDYDFGQGVMFYTAMLNGTSTDFIGAGQKSGQFWALNPDTGAVRWETQVGPGGLSGGLQWGSATDGTRLYVADANSMSTPWTLMDGTTITSGFWAALDPATGEVLWQTANPTGGQIPAPVSVANGVVYGCSLDSAGHMYAMNAATGQILWDRAAGGSCNAGAAIADGTVYWGSGYSNYGMGTPNNLFFAFTAPK